MNELMNTLWHDYVELAPDAKKIHSLFKTLGETIINDHIALRTFKLPLIELKLIAKPFLALGYTEQETYLFAQKKLGARSYTHPDKSLPKIFISELFTDEFSEEFQDICEGLNQEVEAWFKFNPFKLPIKPWKTISFDTYNRLKKESEYAAWLAAFGIRANHFTVSVNSLINIKSIEALNALLKQNGFTLNNSGGEVKGTQTEGLKQSSTMAGLVACKFADGMQNIPGCYYEFAERFVLKDTGKIFDGFVTESADKIFESTDHK